MKYTVMLVVVLFAMFGCVNAVATDKQATIFSQSQRKTADQIISIFENDTPIIQYDYAENLNDGRGITAGRAGFTSATSDMLEVVKRYSKIVPNNPLSRYLPRLKELAENEDGSTDGLNGLEDAWRKCAKDAKFRKVQDEVVDDWYFVPATKQAKSLGIKLPLTLLNLYDAIIQHGEGDDLDGLPSMIKQTTSHVGGTPKDGISEKVWLREFMRVRKAVLKNPHNQETKEEWSKSVGRVDTLEELYKNNKFYLELPIEIDTWGTTYTLTSTP
jgi:chitosanase